MICTSKKDFYHYNLVQVSDFYKLIVTHTFVSLMHKHLGHLLIRTHEYQAHNIILELISMSDAKTIGHHLEGKNDEIIVSS